MYTVYTENKAAWTMKDMGSRQKLVAEPLRSLSPPPSSLMVAATQILNIKCHIFWQIFQQTNKNTKTVPTDNKIYDVNIYMHCQLILFFLPVRQN